MVTVAVLKINNDLDSRDRWVKIMHSVNYYGAEKEFAEEEEEKQKFLLCTQGLNVVCEPIAPPRRCYTLNHQHSDCKHSVDRQHSRLQAQ